MRNQLERPPTGSPAVFLVLALLLTLAAALGGQESPDDAEAREDAACPGKERTYTQVSLTLDWDAETIHVDPESVTVYLPPGPDQPARVCWTISGLQEDQTLHIGTKPGVEDLFPDLERKASYPKELLTSGAPSKTGTWRYELWVSAKGKEGKLLSRDPSVVVEPSG